LNAGDLSRYLRDLQRSLDELAGQLVAGAWQLPTFTNSWVAVSEEVDYRLEPDGDVRFRGRISSGATGTVAFTLPTDFAPDWRQDFPLVTDVAGSFGAARVLADGTVTITLPGGASWVSLANVRFPTS
jgi:hypothetical protein